MAQPLPARCPFCQGPLTVTRLHCDACDITIEGRFSAVLASPLARLSEAQLRFVEAFLRAEGKFSRLERELGLSYPTLRNRLREILQTMGAAPAAGPVPPKTPSSAERQRILDELEAGRISPAEAARRLRGLPPNDAPPS